MPLPTTLYDIAIIGGGPAGAAALMALRGAGLRVLVLERATFPRPKACGDAVPAMALRALEGLRPGIGARLVALPGARPSRCGYVVGPRGGIVRVDFSTPGLVVGRDVFDNLLLQEGLASNPAELRCHALTEVAPAVDGRGFVLHAGPGVEFRARVVIGADGAHSVVRRSLLGVGWRKADLAIAVRAYGRPLTPYEAMDGLGLWFAKSLQPGYGWAFPLADGRLNLGAGMLALSSPGRPLRALLKAWAEGLPPYGPLALTWENTPWLGHPLPLGKVGRPIAGPGFYLTGDAAGLISPATGEGIGQAILSGAWAAEAALEMLQNEKTATGSVDAYTRRVYGAFAATFNRQWLALRVAQAAPSLIDAAVWAGQNSGYARRVFAGL